MFGLQDHLLRMEFESLSMVHYKIWKLTFSLLDPYVSCQFITCKIHRKDMSDRDRDKMRCKGQGATIYKNWHGSAFASNPEPPPTTPRPLIPYQRFIRCSTYYISLGEGADGVQVELCMSHILGPAGWSNAWSGILPLAHQQLNDRR